MGSKRVLQRQVAAAVERRGAHLPSVARRAPLEISSAIQAPGRPLEPAERVWAEARFGHDFSRIRVHAEGEAATSARELGARAFAVGADLVFAPGEWSPGTERGRRLLAHELAHAVQQGMPGGAMPLGGVPIHENQALERDADRAADHALDGGASAPEVVRAPLGLSPNVAEKVLRFGAKWLSKRSVKTISKHIARHTRRIAGRAVHSIFKSPRKVKPLVEQAVKEAIELAAKHPTAPAEQVLEGAGLRITRQAAGVPGKFRWIVQKVFGEAIGTQGERVLRVILDQSGRVVTAFPTDRLAAIGLTAVGIEVLSERTASASERVHATAERMARAEEERESKISLWDFVPFIGDIWGGELNAGEDDMIRQEREILALIADVIGGVEQAEKRSLGPAERAELGQLVRAALATPLVIEAGDEADE
ncbi:MAG TPA: DUF4157 domain-containing protein [Kofleriaceae bacterium]|nr:DUF4157 domain-containing protein [Kofleriaceae bacterium]